MKKNEQKLIRSQVNLRSDTKLKSLYIENMNSKSGVTKKICDSNLNKDLKKKLSKNYNIKKNNSVEDDVSFEIRNESNYEIKNYNEEKQECNEDYNKNCNTIYYGEERLCDSSDGYNNKRYAGLIMDTRNVKQIKSLEEITTKIIVTTNKLEQK